MAYAYFANHYDRLTGNVSYIDRARYFDTIIKQHTDHVELLLDLACGTGSLSAELVNLGYDVIGVDSSAEMLSFAAPKVPTALFLCQDMTSLNLYGTIDVTICALDSLNHITDEHALQQAFNRVAMFTAPEGLFIFDVNSVYKHREILGCNTFFYENDDCCCVWQNEYTEHHHIVNIDLDFFVKDGEHYFRESECFSERAYTPNEMDAFIKTAGLETIAVYGDDTFNDPTNTTQRLIYVTRKLPVERGGISANNTKSIRIRRKTT